MIEMDQINQNVREIAIRLLGEPNKKLSSSRELRFGSHGSMSVDLEGKWYDHEEMEGGGMISLIKRYHGENVAEFLRSMGLETIKPVKPIKEQPIKTITNNQMHDKAKQAEIVTRYSDEFCVMRFEGKVIRPFSKLANGDWVMKRPDHKLPLNIVNDGRDETLPVLIVEGEKSALGGQSLYPGVVVCWHGGVSALEQSDWTQLDGYQDFILFPDNDSPGVECMRSLKKILDSKSGRTIKIAAPPSHWREKDDLWDCFERGEVFDVAEWVKENEMDAKNRAIYFNYGDFADKKYPEMTWMVENLLARGHLGMIHAQPGHGKSLMSQVLSVCMAAGYNFGHYHIPKPQKVLYIDAEMPPVALQNRWSDMLLIFNGEPEREELIKRVKQNLIIMSHHDQPNGIIPLNEEAGREWYYDLVDEVNPDCIILDNLLTLMNIEMNDSTEWVEFAQPLLLKARREDRAVWFVHHSGKSGKQLGSMAKEVVLDFVIRIELQGIDEEEDDSVLGFDTGIHESRFKWTFEKTRHFYGQHSYPILWKYSNGILTKEQSTREARIDKVVLLKKEGLSNRQIAKELNVSNTTVNSDVKYAETTGAISLEPEF